MFKAFGCKGAMMSRKEFFKGCRKQAAIRDGVNFFDGIM
jgi:hypothetical protein